MFKKILLLVLFVGAFCSDTEFNSSELEPSFQRLYNDSGEITPDLQDGRYRPNCITVYQLTPHLYNDSRVLITLWYLDIDEAAGEYLIIGAGKTPFEGPPGIFLTGRKRTAKEYYVAAEDVYVAFVARSSNRTSAGFRLTWIRNGTRIFDEQDNVDNTVDDSVLKSLPICIYNASYVQEFYDGRGRDEIFPQLREKISQIANEYANEKGIHLSTPVKKSSVRFNRISSVLPPSPDDSEMTEGVVTVMVTIVKRFDETKAVFSSWQLQEILHRLDLYDRDSNHFLLGTKVGRCPLPVDYTSWRIGVYVLVPTLCLLFFVFWVTRHMSLCKTHQFRKHRMLDMPTEKGPKICVTAEDDVSNYSRVTPLSDDDSDIEIFNKLRSIPRRRNDLPDCMKGGYPVSALQAPSFERRTEGDRKRIWQSSNIAKIMGAETGNVYDSLETNMNMKQFEHASVTKL